MQIINRLHIDNAVLAGLAAALLLVILSASVSATKSLYAAENREIGYAVRHIGMTL
ncbi:hypothetical protein U8607_24385 [Methylobacterium durans]|uniref:hypothetical protein n=1 Tax=Methylobacterium durans TaxID=2202825 RepID=UPI002AFED279|nr:hypothetical protein [Methylobacterium durans]MEA1835225.1 hypothetical protein [Methylobacterium durans]